MEWSDEDVGMALAAVDALEHDAAAPAGQFERVRAIMTRAVEVATPRLAARISALEAQVDADTDALEALHADYLAAQKQVSKTSGDLAAALADNAALLAVVREAHEAVRLVAEDDVTEALLDAQVNLGLAMSREHSGAALLERVKRLEGGVRDAFDCGIATAANRIFDFGSRTSDSIPEESHPDHDWQRSRALTARDLRHAVEDLALGLGH